MSRRPNEEKSRSSQQEWFNLRLLAPPPLPSPKLRLPVYSSSNAEDLLDVNLGSRVSRAKPTNKGEGVCDV